MSTVLRTALLASRTAWLHTMLDPCLLVVVSLHVFTKSLQRRQRMNILHSIYIARAEGGTQNERGVGSETAWEVKQSILLEELNKFFFKFPLRYIYQWTYLTNLLTNSNHPMDAISMASTSWRGGSTSIKVSTIPLKTTRQATIGVSQDDSNLTWIRNRKEALSQRH